MNVVGLTWYLSGVLALLTVLASFVTYHPDAERLGRVLQAVFGVGAVLGFGAAVLLGRLPATHWIRQSRPLRIGLVGAAVFVTVLLLLALAG